MGVLASRETRNVDVPSDVVAHDVMSGQAPLPAPFFVAGGLGGYQDQRFQRGPGPSARVRPSAT
jgi:hypothetical protein